MFTWRVMYQQLLIAQTFDFTSSSLKVWVNNNSYIIYLLSFDWQYLLLKLNVIA
ncbi:MAG: hypothetical protein RQ856_06225 [Candidatus Izemoplasmatales bacterium]|nr:hypothetical protein [Candidatus Izemoplasmatales bacterium]